MNMRKRPSFVGKYHTLEVVKRVDFGLYLDADGEEILLPTKYVPANANIGERLRVFVYRDSEDRLIATTLQPAARIGEFAALPVVATTSHQRLAVGRKYLVRIMLDRTTDRVMASARLEQFLDDNPADALREDQEVSLTVWEYTEIGIKAVIEDRYQGLLYRNEVFTDLFPGDRLTGYIKKVRDDGKVDVTLRKKGYEEVQDAQEVVFRKLMSNGGTLPLTDNSAPEEINKWLGMSKKTFKRAVGGLYKAGKVRLAADAIYLITEE
jgi:predicted RNA-binding protein (virulence factor B family)